MRLRRIAILIVMLVSSLLAAGTVLADNPHFVRASISLDGANLVVAFKEAGLGDNVLIDYEANANATADYACINGGNNHPQAANKETVSGPVSAFGTFSSGKNGTISQSLTLSPPGPGDFSCPNGQRLVLAAVSYTNVTLSDLTNSVQVFFPGTYTAVFFVF